MSSQTRYRVRARNISVDAAAHIPLNQVLGPQGQRLLRDTLANLPALRKDLGVSPTEGVAQTRLDQALGWQPVGQSGGKRFELRVGGASLPARLVEQGLDHVQVSLEVSGGVARVRYQTAYQTPGAQPVETAEVAALTRTVAARAVNQLLAVTVAKHLNQQVTRYVQQAARHEVQMRATHTGLIRTYAHVGR
jgi:hypothetical protein